MAKTVEKWLVIAAFMLALGATAWSYFNGYVLAYGDAESHLNIAKRVTDSITPGLAQLGGIWLPLPHILLIPFTKINLLWRTGIAGSIVSGFFYIVSSVYIYKLTMLVTNNRIASAIAYLAFALNPNVLYMQTTAMTELPLIGFFILSIFNFLNYLKNPSKIFLLVSAGFFGFCATLSRYDGWPLVAVEGIILLFRAIPKGKIIMFSTLAFSGIMAWLVWDGLILGDPLYFTNSPFSAKSQQKGWLERGQLLTYHSLPLSIAYYATATIENAGVALAGVAVLGLALWLIDPIIKEKWETLMLLMVPFGFYVLTLFLGQSIILIPGVTPQNYEWQLFNIRYGLPMVPAIAFMAGYTAYRLEQIVSGQWANTKGKMVVAGTVPKPTFSGLAGRSLQGILLAIVLFQLFLFANGEQKVMVWEDGAHGLSSSLRYHLDAQGWLRNNYKDGLVLLDDYARTVSVIGSGLPMEKVIYVGNKPYWDISMSEPEKYAQWIVMQKDDDIWKNIYDRPDIQARLYKYFEKAYTSPEVLIFKRNGT